MSTTEKNANSKARHDLRTPINQIIGYAELLQEEAEDSGHDEYVGDLEKIQKAARRMIELVDEHLSPTKAAGAVEQASVADAPPPVAADAPPRTTEDTADDLPARRPGTDRIPTVKAPLLVVDDNEMNRDMLSRRLKSRGYIVETAEDGYEALAMIDKGAFDLVLLDVMMPGISGLEVLEKLRVDKGPAELPVIMATAKDTSEDIVAALKLGANDYVTKPLDFRVVLARVQSALSLKHATDEIQRLAEHLEKHNVFIRNTFGRYLSDEIVESLLEKPEGLALGGERRQVTILMSDLRGFTSLAERVPPEVVVKILNNYLGEMAEIIMKYRGTIDEFIGDAILVIFGAPVQRPDDAQRAVACAAAMQLAMETVNAFNHENELPSVEMGIAVHTGEVVVGNIGSQMRAKYGVVGTTVNLTSRIETYTVGGQVLVSQATLDAAGDVVEIGSRTLVKAKGAKEPIPAYDLRGIGGELDVHLPVREEKFLQLEREIPVRTFTIDGKHVSDTAAPGAFVSLSGLGAEVRAETPIPPLTNVKFVVTGRHGTEIEGDLYAKVVESPEACKATYVVRFTSSPPEVDEYLTQVYESLGG